MKRKGMYMFFLLGIVMYIFTSYVCQVEASESKNKANRFNVVFVMDTSGSMRESDESQRRYDAVDLFLGLSADTGNNFGAVVFNDRIVDVIDMMELSGNSSKMAFSDRLRSEPVSGDTNIGAALLEAVKMLDTSGNRELPSVIILLTDGNTDLKIAGTDISDENALKKAEKDKETALESARQNYYQIYSVFLNEDGSANTSELQATTEAEGEFDQADIVCKEIKYAEDIKGIFEDFYNLIYGTETVTIFDEALPEEGICEKEFKIPSFGVEEVNIIISTLDKDTTYTIKSPKRDSPYTEEELIPMKISAGTFSVIKIVDPDSGWWKISVRGTSGDKVKITMVYNADYRICLENEGQMLNKGLGDTISLKAYLIDGNERLSDEEVYQENNAVLIVDFDGEQQTRDMDVKDNEYISEYILDDYGDYVFQVSTPIQGMTEISGTLTVQVENQPPYTAQESETWRIREWSFGKKTYSYDLTSLVSDIEDSVLQYEMEADNLELQPRITSDGYLLLDNELTFASVFKEKIKREGCVTIRAMDTQGASCEFEVNISLTAMNLLLGRIIAVLLVVFVLAIFIQLWRIRNRKFNGDITIKAFDEQRGFYGRSHTLSPSKGKIVLSDYVHDECGIALRRIWLHATGKEYIYLKSSKGYYRLYGDRREKKIRLEDNDEVVISDKEDLSSGIRITYHYNGNNMY